MTGQAITSRGIDLAWDRSGVGPTLVWGHGLTSSRSAEDEGALVDWPTTRERLDVVRYDARGHGESGFSDDLASYGWADLAAAAGPLAHHDRAAVFVDGLLDDGQSEAGARRGTGLVGPPEAGIGDGSEKPH